MTSESSVSLLNAFLCLSLEKPFMSDNVCELEGVVGPGHEEKLSELLLPLARGDLNCTGYLSRVRLNAPAFDVEVSDEQIQAILNGWRFDEDFVLGRDEEDKKTAIHPRYWQKSMVILEKSSLWVADADSDLEARWRRMRPFPPEEYERPFECLELICFSDVALAVGELNAYFKSAQSERPREAPPTDVRNPRNAGRKAHEDWGAVRQFLLSKIEEEPSHRWRSWPDLWADVVAHLKNAHGRETKGTEKALKQWLRDKDAETLEQLKKRISTSRSSTYM